MNENDIEQRDISKPQVSWPTRLRYRMTSDIDPAWADTILLGCFFVTGMLDATAFTTWECFVGMQTGNTLFAGLGISGLPGNVPRYTWTKSLIAIASFCLGAFSFARFHRHFGPQRRWVIVSSMFFQMALMLITAALATTGLVGSGAPPPGVEHEFEFPWVELCPIALLAFQSAGQVVLSRMLKYNAIPTVVVTSVMCDLFSDPLLLKAGLTENADRNRRATGVLCVFAGAAIAGAVVKSSIGYAGSLWIVTGVKALMVVAWLVWPSKHVQHKK